MLEQLSGETRLYFTVGFPIAQVKSPGGITRGFEARGADAVLVPIEVPPDRIDAFFELAAGVANLDGMVATVPYKFRAHAACATVSGRAELLGVANVMRRNPDGGWHGDMTDGIGFCNAVRAKGVDPAGRRALLVGAGGAGSAIGLSLLDAGVAELAVFDLDPGRRDALVARLSTRHRNVAAAADADPTGFALVANASPAGMRPGDPLPVAAAMLAPAMYVGDVVTAPAVPPLIVAARAAGCTTSTGTEMYEAQVDAIADFLLGRD